MKSLLHLLIAALVISAANAGEYSFYNDLRYPRWIRISHKGQKLFAGWVFSGQRVLVDVDTNRPGKPILWVDVRGASNNSSYFGSSNTNNDWKIKAHRLPKKESNLAFNLSWFPRGY